MDIILGLYTLIIICLFILIDVLLSGKILIIKNIAVGTANYLIAFMVVSLTAFALDKYSLLSSYAIITLLAVILLAIICHVKYKTMQALTQIEKVRYLPISLIVIMVIGLLFSFQKFDVYGTEQDQGIYQQNALLMTSGLENKVVTIKEYDMLTNEPDRQLFLQAMNTQALASVGFYPIRNNDNRGTIKPGTYPVNSAIFHGLPNLPALLSITGKIFGTEHIMHGLTLPYLIAIILIFIALDLNLGLSKLTCSIVTMLFAVSPIILWTSKASLTEIYLAMIISLFIFYLANKDSNHSWLLFIPVLAFSFFHVSIYTVMPMFVLLFLGLSLYRRDFGAWLSGVLSVMFYGIGYMVMSYCGPQYVFNNYRHLAGIFNKFGLNIFRSNSSQFPIVYATVFIVLVIFVWVYYHIFYKKKAVTVIGKYVTEIINLLAILCMCALTYRWVSFSNMIPENANVFNRYHGGGLINTLPNLTIFAYAFGTGFVLLVIILAQIIRKNERLIQTEALPITFMFLYTVVFISSFLRLETRYYYYYARYTTPYIPVIIVLGGIVIEKIKLDKKVIVAVLSAGIMLPFSGTLAVSKDISRMDFKSYREVVESVQSFEPGSIVLLGNELRQFFYNEISVGSDCYVYPIDLFVNFSDTSFADERKIYSIVRGNNYLQLGDKFGDMQLGMIKKSLLSTSHAFRRWVTGWSNGPTNLLSPIESETLIRIISIEKIEPEPLLNLSLQFGKGDNDWFYNDWFYNVSGFSYPENGFRWAEGNKAVLRFRAHEDVPDNLMVSFALIPLLKRGVLDRQRVEVIVNENNVADWELTGTTIKEIPLPKSLMKNQRFDITFLLPDAISPRELGINNDTRKLAVAFRAVQFFQKQ